ncbi:MAG: hypothetical protein DRP70_14565 [Spirochaetes bacterium]|nr:MAG: hypothetical protein DRP60_15265 [Spirochaetota bacterium]RKX83570.1 MAG: hypothetical protein DRP70_14565 [Spirochaetota bacterium]RKX94929.1 MAG: hypothetical protein DRZ90_11080 [Spirochaetota bacterium]
MPYRKGRQCRQLSGRRGFKPMGIPVSLLEQVVLTLDEFETLRICDLEGKKQIEAGEAMGVSRGTVQRLLVKARAKVVDALLNQKILVLVNGFDQEVPEVKEVQ